MSRSIFQNWKPELANSENNFKEIKTSNLNFGPQHPAAHGVLRLILQLSGETIEKLDPHIGLLHRGTEKLIEDRPYIKSIPYFDRLDYVSMLMQEHAFCLGIEDLLKTNAYSSSTTYVRVLFDELTRILNHMLAVSCHALDVGSMSALFWAFEEREKIMEFYERVSGARMHAAFYRPNETGFENISVDLIYDIVEFTRNCLTTLNEMHNVLTYNKIWKQRLSNVAAYGRATALDFGLSGVMLRCVGVKRDLRLTSTDTYSNYYYLNFRSFYGEAGDAYDRFLIRMAEMAESINIIKQITIKILEAKQNLRFEKKNKHFKKNLKGEYSSMEAAIEHFKYWSEGFSISPEWVYRAIESAKGEFGVSIVANNSPIPYRCKIKSPAYAHLQLTPTIAKGHFLADLATIVGTIDIVFGEVDR